MKYRRRGVCRVFICVPHLSQHDQLNDERAFEAVLQSRLVHTVLDWVLAKESIFEDL